MIRSFHLADWITVGNAVFGMGAIFSAMAWSSAAWPCSSAAMAWMRSTSVSSIMLVARSVIAFCFASRSSMVGSSATGRG